MTPQRSATSASGQVPALTPGQQRIWFAETFEDATPAYNVPASDCAGRVTARSASSRSEMALWAGASRRCSMCSCRWA
jgi:hypothetical protein